MLPWLLCGTLFLLLIAACFRLWSLRRALGELAGQLSCVLSEDTNVLLGLSTRDRYARKLAAELNRELAGLRRMRWRYLSGDRELKEAVTNISHDLRTPLTAICGYLELLEREDKSEAVCRYLGYIGERAETMRRLTEELFCYSVLLSPESAPELYQGDLRAVLESGLAGAFPSLMERGIEPELELPEGPVLCLMDEAAASRVIGNLLSNAVRYSGGDLKVRLTEDAVLTFENSAPGLDEVSLGKLFDRFYTVEAARGTTGLGLAIARTLMEQMRGSISASLGDGRLRLELRFVSVG